MLNLKLQTKSTQNITRTGKQTVQTVQSGMHCANDECASEEVFHIQTLSKQDRPQDKTRQVPDGACAKLNGAKKSQCECKFRIEIEIKLF